MGEKKKHKVMIGIEVILLGMIIAIVGTNAASSNPPSNGVSYNKNNQTTVEGALNDLYTKANYGNASAAQILKGKTALVGGKKVTGTYEVPTLASQTPGNATAENIDEGKIAWVNGEKVVGATRKLAEKLKLGDYISYTPSNTSYIVSKNDTRYSSDVIINPNELNLWRVIRITKDGTVEIVSEAASSSRIYFSREDEDYTRWYPKYIGILNKIAASYETEGYTVGSRHVGYDGKAEENLSSSISTPDEGYQTDIDLLKAIDGLAAKEMWIADGLYSNQNKTNIRLREYLLASRGQIYTTPSNTKYATVMKVHVNSIVSSIYSDGYIRDTIEISSTKYGDGAQNFGYVRPIVYLHPNVKITGGKGTRGNPWTLGIK